MKKMKFRLKLHLGFHIPLEICDKCRHRCPNYGKDHSETNKQRKEIAEYLRSINVGPIYMYNSLPDMYDAVDFDCCHPNNSGGGADYHLNNSILILDINDSGNLIISSITTTVEDEWYEELQKFGKITYFYNIIKNR